MKSSVEEIDEFFLHVFVNVAAAGEGFAAFHFTAEKTDKIGVFDFLVEIADESASGDVATCDFVERMVLFCPSSFIRYRYYSVHSASCEYLLGCFVVFLRTDT